MYFGSSPEKLKVEYLDVYEGVYAKVISMDRFEEDTDLSTTYLGQVDMNRSAEVKAEEHFPITALGYTKGKLLDGTECDILVDTGASKLYMSKTYCMRCKSLHSLPKSVSVQPKEQKLIVFEVPFVEKISGMAITKMLDVKEQKTLIMKLKFIRNRATFKVTNSTHETVTFDPKEMLGIVDLRSLGYYKINKVSYSKI